MTDDPTPVPGAEPPRGPDERLESWKDIAAFLRRDVRTVQRWEQTDGLPIHRHKRAQRPIPYAYKAELDAWWAGRPPDGRSAAGPSAPVEARPSRRRQLIGALAAALVVVAASGGYWLARARAPRESSVAVLPFLDLTEGMTSEEFADGMTEELITRLSKIPGLRVPAPTASFYFKNKQVPIAEIARSLDVAYVLDGSVRKSGATVRVAARLIRTDNADVVWSDTFDRPLDDILMVQDDIAGQVTKALKTSIEAAHGLE